MIIVGDLHLKPKLPYLNGLLSLFEWLNKYKDNVLVLLGDCFDTSSPIWDVYTIFEKFLIDWNNDIHIIQGNHCFSKRKGLSLSGFSLLNKIHVYNNIEKVEIENKKCLMLPFKYSNMKEEYENLTGDYDLVFGHITHSKEAFGDEGIELNVNAQYYIYGHTHTPNIHGRNKNHIILGVPSPTRHLEHNQKYNILKIDSGIEFIEVPQYFTFENVIFGEQPKNKNNIINVLKAPSVNSVYEMYKDCYIRNDGIELEIDEEDYNVNEIINMKEETKSVFMEFAKAKQIEKKYVDCCLEFL